MTDSRSYRDALGRYPTGVTIVTTYVEGKAIGMTVNSFASVSLDPRLVLWSVEHGTDRYKRFAEAQDYAINVLAADQAGLAHACAIEPDLRACHAEWQGETALKRQHAHAVRRRIRRPARRDFQILTAAPERGEVVIMARQDIAGLAGGDHEA